MPRPKKNVDAGFGIVARLMQQQKKLKKRQKVKISDIKKALKNKQKYNAKYLQWLRQQEGEQPFNRLKFKNITFL